MEPVKEENLKIIANELQRLIEQEESGVLVVVIASAGSAPGKVGFKMLVLADGHIHGTIGGGVIEARVMADALNALEDGRGPRSIPYDLNELGMSCGGSMTVYIEPLLAPRRVVIFGAGHVGAAVARQLKLLGCTLTVVDERKEWANREQLPGVDEIVNRPFAEHLAECPPGSKDHVVIVTRGHEQDQLVLDEVVERRPAYLGMIGSRRKAKKSFDLLRDRGVAEEAISAVRCPMGIAIGAATPEEIAISLAAELINLWRKGSLPADRNAVAMKGQAKGRAKAAAPQAAPARPSVRELAPDEKAAVKKEPPDLPKQDSDPHQDA